MALTTVEVNGAKTAASVPLRKAGFNRSQSRRSLAGPWLASPAAGGIYMRCHAAFDGVKAFQAWDQVRNMLDWNGNLHPLNLAAIVYRPTDDADGLLARFADNLIRRGHRLGGIVQRNTKGEAGRRERMEVIDLMTGRAVRICQDLGKDAAACKLNPAGLAEAATLVTRAVAAGVELVVVNKFSKQEAAGRGLRAEIAEAAAAGLPLLTAVSDSCYRAWMGFTGGFGTTLLCERRVVEHWWDEMSMRTRCARIAAQAREASTREVSARLLPDPAVLEKNVGRPSRFCPPSLADNHVR